MSAHQQQQQQQQQLRTAKDGRSPAKTKGNARAIPLLRSCERCRRRKQRCDGEQPVCGRCKSHSSDCSYRQSGRFRKRFPRGTGTATEQQQQQQQTDDVTEKSAMSSASSEQTSPILFMLPPELSPSGMGMSPESAGLETPLVDPMAVLRTRDLPDLAQGLSEPIAQQMAGLIGGFTEATDKNGRLEPNLALLDPRNAAGAGDKQYTSVVEGAEWLRADDPLRLIESDSDSGSGSMALATLQGVAQRHGIVASAPTLLAMLRASFVDATTRMRTRQFWATLHAGRAGDFAVLAHVAIAAREAQLSSRGSVDARVEGACFDAAQREWAAGRVVATTGAVYGLLLLSEYGFQTGRTAVLWDYATHAMATVRRIRLRGHAFPWRSARASACDVEYEHMLACFWCVWGRVFTAAQALARHIDDSPEPLMPELPEHTLCQDLAQPVADAGDAPGAVRFAASSQCPHSAQGAYMAATWRCCLMAVPVHNCHVDLLERRCEPARFLAALRAWDDRAQAWRAACWHPAWESRLAAIVGSQPVLPSSSDSWLVLLAIMHSTLRLRMHRAALALLLHADERPLLPGAALTPPPPPPPADADSELTPLTGDALRDSAERHRCRFVCLESASLLESLLHACNRVDLPLTRFGIWVVFVLEQVASVHCSRTGRREGTAAQLDAVHRLANVMRHLVSLRKWTAALYVFTSIVKALLVDHDDPDKWTVPLDRIPETARSGPCAIHYARVDNSPWPQNHVLTMLIRELHILPRQFCAYTVPVVYASIMTSTAPIPASVRMRIASLLS
ncbi:hypothetical protein EV175_001373 [Coemansia sp. RSA 1933]|nr:hypothetical protein EV175_001373 [Coemansia sp. RSA 1933]